MRKNKEEVLNAYLTLVECGAQIQLKLGVNNYDDLDDIIYIIENTPSFNNKCNKQIAHTFKNFYSKLPTYQSLMKDNPNNGKPNFDITLIDDDCIELIATYLTEVSNNMDIDALYNAVDEYGTLWDADEHDVSTQLFPTGFIKEYKIRFWWD